MGGLGTPMLGPRKRALQFDIWKINDQTLVFHFGVIYAKDSEFNIGLIMRRHSTNYLTD